MRTAIKLLTSLVGTFLFVVALSNPAFASTITREISTSVQVLEKNKAQVTQIQKISWDDKKTYFPAKKNALVVYIVAPYVNSDIEIAEKISNIQVKDQYGANITFATSTEEDMYKIRIPYYRDLKSTSSLEFRISYQTDINISLDGGMLEITYPGLSEDFKVDSVNADAGYSEHTTYSLTFSIQNSLGEISMISPAAAKVDSAGAVTKIHYTHNEMIGRSMRIMVGNERLIKFVFSGKTFATNQNSPDFVKNLLVNYIEVALPTQRNSTEFANQIVYFSRISPYPESLRTDEDGNIIARLPVSAVADGEIIIEGYAKITKGILPESIKKTLHSEIPGNMENYLLGESRYWQIDNANIKKVASEQLSDSGLVYETVRKSLKYVSNLISYEDVESREELSRKGAVSALESRKGVCMEYSDLLLSILRAQKIPTRTVFGDGLGARVDRELEGVGHQWVGVWFPEAGWIPVDPTWSDEGREYIGYDFDHFVWYVASKSVTEPSGFDCFSEDATQPCKEALEIFTESVDVFPDISELFTIDSVKEQIAATQKSGFEKYSSEAIAYLRSSRLGRLILSTQGIIILFAVALYALLVFIVSLASTAVRKAKVKQNPSLIDSPISEI